MQVVTCGIERSSPALCPSRARAYLDEVGVTKEHRFLEVSITAFQSIAFQELLLKLESHFGFGSIKLYVVGGPRTNLETNRQKELRSCREAGQPTRSARTGDC